MADFAAKLEDKSQKEWERIVIFEIWAGWCPECEILDPRINALLASYRGDIPVSWVRTDLGPATRDKKPFIDEWGIVGLPHVGIFYNGMEIQQAMFEGVQSDSKLKEWLDSVEIAVKDLPSSLRPASRQGFQLSVEKRAPA